MNGCAANRQCHCIFGVSHVVANFKVNSSKFSYCGNTNFNGPSNLQNITKLVLKKKIKNF